MAVHLTARLAEFPGVYPEFKDDLKATRRPNATSLPLGAASTAHRGSPVSLPVVGDSRCPNRTSRPSAGHAGDLLPSPADATPRRTGTLRAMAAGNRVARGISATESSSAARGPSASPATPIADKYAAMKQVFERPESATPTRPSPAKFSSSPGLLDDRRHRNPFSPSPTRGPSFVVAGADAAPAPLRPHAASSSPSPVPPATRTLRAGSPDRLGFGLKRDARARPSAVYESPDSAAAVLEARTGSFRTRVPSKRASAVSTSEPDTGFNLGVGNGMGLNVAGSTVSGALSIQVGSGHGKEQSRKQWWVDQAAAQAGIPLTEDPAEASGRHRATDPVYREGRGAGAGAGGVEVDAGHKAVKAGSSPVLKPIAKASFRGMRPSKRGGEPS